MKTLLVVMILVGCSVAQKCEPKDRDSCCWVGVTEGCNGGACNPEQAGLHWDTKTCKWEMPGWWKADVTVAKPVPQLHTVTGNANEFPKPSDEKGCAATGGTWVDGWRTDGDNCVHVTVEIIPKCQNGIIWEGHEICTTIEREYVPVWSWRECPASAFVGADTKTCQIDRKVIGVDGKVVWKE